MLATDFALCRSMLLYSKYGEQFLVDKCKDLKFLNTLFIQDRTSLSPVWKIEP